ncbi:MAG: glycosyltransferase [Actinomycetota bacterium]|nr:glycosyltransferase [Actinomycetota bacterium]
MTNQALACRALFTQWGWSGEDYSPVIAAGMPRRVVRPLHELAPRSDEILLLHYSGYAPGLERLFEASQRGLLISHNITPPEFFWAYEPVDAVRCELAHGQLAALAPRFGALAGVSEYNARQLRELSLREAAVIPVLFDLGRLGAPGAPPTGPPSILFVGRLVPHKRQDLVIAAFARYRDAQPDARLVLVGVPLSPAYGAQLQALAQRLAPGAVTFQSAISDAELAERYRSAHAFLCLSEHEGFCIPLLEAFHFGVPVIARDVGAVGEVVGDAGVLLGEGDDLATVAELLRIVVGEPDLRDELRARGRRRLEFYDHARAAGRLREALEGLGRP